MVAQHAAVHVHDLAGIGGAGAQFLDHGGVIAVGHEADVLAVGLVGHRKPVFRGERAGFGLGGEVAQREAQEIELFLRGGEQEIGLVARGIGGAVQLRPVSAPILRWM
jgi:hypothetical protein